MDILVKGCIQLDDIKVINFDHLVVEKKILPDQGYISMTIVVTEIQKYMKSIEIQAKCDRQWKSDNKPQSHLVRLRTDP